MTYYPDLNPDQDDPRDNMVRAQVDGMRFWCVLRFGDGRAPTAKHDTRAQAVHEAHRLAVTNPGVTFHIAAVTGAAMQPKPPPQPTPETKWTELRRPGDKRRNTRTVDLGNHGPQWMTPR